LQAAITADETASRNIQLMRKQVDQGQISIAILLTAQQAYLQTSLARVQAEAARLADTVALFQALGGGWWNRPVIEGGPAALNHPVVSAEASPNP
jgi:outer membrane protein TolC